MTATPRDLLAFERPLLARGHVVVGLDEVGRGALAGPVTVGAVVLQDERPAPVGLDDSKRLSPARRSSLVEPIRWWASAWSLGSSSAAEIDDWGLRLALAVAATRALEGLVVTPTYALIDGTVNLLQSPGAARLATIVAPPLVFERLRVTTVIKGDQLCATIAAASILAKVQRDSYMVGLHEEYDEYQWARNKGYGAPEHLDALRRRGACEHHRTSWNLPRADSA